MLAAITMSLGAVCIEFARGIGSRTAGRLRAGIYIELNCAVRCLILRVRVWLTRREKIQVTWQ